MKLRTSLLTVLLCTALSQSAYGVTAGPNPADKMNASPIMAASIDIIDEPNATNSKAAMEPSKLYGTNQVDTELINTYKARVLENFDKKKPGTTRLTRQDVEQFLEPLSEYIRAANYNSSIFILTDKDRAIQFTMPRNSSVGLVTNEGNTSSLYLYSLNGNLGIEVMPIKDRSTWESTGKSYDALTKTDIVAMLKDHHPNSPFVNGDTFTYPGLTNGTWDVITTKENDHIKTVSTINFSLPSQPDYMYHIGTINDTLASNFESDVKDLQAFVLPTITIPTQSPLVSSKETFGQFTYPLLNGMKLVTDKSKGSEGVKTYRNDNASQVIMVTPFNKELTPQNALESGFKFLLSQYPYTTYTDKTQHYTVWHNGTPGFLVDSQGDAGNIMSYITHDGKSLFIHSLIYRPQSFLGSHDDLMTFMIDTVPATNDKVGINTKDIKIINAPADQNIRIDEKPFGSIVTAIREFKVEP